jgi:hypothetical protein
VAPAARKAGVMIDPGLRHSLELFIGAALTLMVFSFLYRDNPLYKIAEHVFVGVSAAYWMVIGFWTTLWPNVVVKLFPAAQRVTNPDAPLPPRDATAIVPLVLGLLMLCRLWPRLAWISRWPTAFAVGTTVGYSLIRYLRSDFLSQISATIDPGVMAAAAGGSLWSARLDYGVIVVGTFCALAYFTFSRSGRGGIDVLARVGLVFLMITFGASFGSTVMGRVTLLVGRLRFLLGDWLGLISG